MARQAVERKQFSFIGGLNTEAGFLTFPENAWLDGDNMIPQIDGSVERRLKIDYESNAEFAPTISENQKNTNAFSVFRWEAVGGDGVLNFFVVQEGKIVRFYDLVETSITPNRKSFTIDLESYISPDTPNTIGTNPIECTTGNGKLLIGSIDTDPILVVYNADSDTITVTEQTIQIRDLIGLDDGLQVDEQPATLSVNHNYNLLNQGWNSTKITAYEASVGDFPANSQIWFQGKNSTDDFDPALLVKQDFGSSEAPKGRFLLDLFSRDRADVSGVATIPVESEIFRPRTVAFFAGRAWYAGIPSTTISSWIMFSQVVTSDDKYAKCYQAADPTSEFSPGLVPSDGGVIPIPEAGSILKLVPTHDSLLVFAETGVWRIAGGPDGFSATEYFVEKTTPFGALSQSAIVEIEDTIVYWSNGGIFIISPDDVSNHLRASSLSQEKIQTLYTNIPSLGKRYARGIYNPETKIVMWLFNSSPNDDGITDRFKKDKFLILDANLKSFYTYSLGSLETQNPTIVGGGLAVNQGNSVDGNSRVFKFLTVGVTGGTLALTFSDFEALEDSPDKFMDWFSADGIGVETNPLPYVVSGYDPVQEGSKDKQANYILTFMKKTETGFDSNLDAKNISSAILQAQWGWTNHIIANRWSVGEEVYRKRHTFTPVDSNDLYLDGYPVIVAKTKARGKGKVLSLKWSSSSGKDMKIIGWAIPFGINTNV